MMSVDETEQNAIKPQFMEHMVDREWYAIRTKPRQEDVAKLNYEKQGLITYLPKILTVIRHARKVRQVPRPLFPGYLFLHLSPEEMRWTTISSTYGSLGPVRFGDYYPSVPNWIIDEIRNREDEKGLISLSNYKKSDFKKGDKVKVSLHHYEELEGIFLAKRGQDRAVVLLNILKRQTKTEVPLTNLKAA